MEVNMQNGFKFSKFYKFGLMRVLIFQFNNYEEIDYLILNKNYISITFKLRWLYVH